MGTPGPRWEGADPATLERILVHLVQEYARHLGHLDIVAELANGQLGKWRDYDHQAPADRVVTRRSNIRKWSGPCWSSQQHQFSRQSRGSQSVQLSSLTMTSRVHLVTAADRLLGSYRRWPFLAIVAAVLFSGACQPDRHAVSSVQTEIVSATLVPPSELTLPAGLEVAAALRLPREVHARNYGARAGKRYLAFGVGLQGADGNDAPLPAGSKAEYGVADLATGRIVIHRAEQSGATADINVVFSAPDGDWLVRREDRSRPAQECPQSPQYCWDWTLYAQHLPDGPSTVIAGSIHPGPQFFLPQPALSAQSVLWLDASTTPAGTADLVQWQPGRGVAVLAKAIPFGRLSATDTDGWVGTDDRGGHQLLRIPTKGSRWINLVSGLRAATVVLWRIWRSRWRGGSRCCGRI